MYRFVCCFGTNTSKSSFTAFVGMLITTLVDVVAVAVSAVVTPPIVSEAVTPTGMVPFPVDILGVAMVVKIKRF